MFFHRPMSARPVSLNTSSGIASEAWLSTSGGVNTAAMMKHQELPWITLVTCRGYDEASNSYKYRVLVRAVLVEVN